MKATPRAALLTRSLLCLSFLFALPALARAQTDVFFDVPDPKGVPWTVETRAARTVDRCAGQAGGLPVTFKPDKGNMAGGSFAVSTGDGAIATAQGGGNINGGGAGQPVTAVVNVTGVSEGTTTLKVVWSIANEVYTDVIKVVVRCCKLDIDCTSPVTICPDGSPTPAKPVFGCPPIQLKGVRSDGKSLNATYPAGQTITVTWTATDRTGASKSCVQTVMVIQSPGPWYADVQLTKKIQVPPNLVKKCNDALHKIPGLGGAFFKEARAGVKAKQRDCCDQTGNLVKGGIKDGSGYGTLSVRVKGLPIWGPPRIFLDFDVGVAKVLLELQVGVYFDTDISVGGQIGLREDRCGGNQNCVFGDVAAQLTLTFKAGIEGQACIEPFWGGNYCADLTIIPAAIRASFSVGGSYNKNTCQDGLRFNAALGQVLFLCDLGVGPWKFSYQYVICNGWAF